MLKSAARSSDICESQIMSCRESAEGTSTVRDTVLSVLPRVGQASIFLHGKGFNRYEDPSQQRCPVLGMQHRQVKGRETSAALLERHHDYRIKKERERK